MRRYFGSLWLQVQVIFHAATLALSVHLVPAGFVETRGAAGFSSFSFGNITYLVSANFWDGVDKKMAAYSTVHIVKYTQNDLNFELAQSIYSRGAHGVDYLEIPSFDHIDQEVKKCIVIPSYYYCEVGKKCPATKIYSWVDAIGKFTEAVAIDSTGPSQTVHFRVGRRVFIAIAENFASVVSIYELRSVGGVITSSAVQELGVAGAAACAVHTIAGCVYLVAASYHDKGWQTRSKIFALEESSLQFQEVQQIITHGAHDAEMIEFRGRHFLIFAEDRDSGGSLINSNVRADDPTLPFLLLSIVGFRCTCGTLL
jgi:hypothetical protein